jgi:hypothetical protein
MGKLEMQTIAYIPSIKRIQKREVMSVCLNVLYPKTLNRNLIKFGICIYI